MDVSIEFAQKGPGWIQGGRVREEGREGGTESFKKYFLEALNNIVFISNTVNNC